MELQEITNYLVNNWQIILVLAVVVILALKFIKSTIMFIVTVVVLGAIYYLLKTKGII